MHELWKTPEEVREVKAENSTRTTLCNIPVEQLNLRPPMPTTLNMQGKLDIKGEQSGDENTYLDPSTLIPLPVNMHDDTTIKGEPSEDERTYTVLDSQLVKSLNRPKPKRAEKRIRSKQQVAKKHTHPKKIKTIKCTPIDRNINATQKLLFQQLRNIKLEIKLKPVSHESHAGPSFHSLKPKKVKKIPTTSPGRQENLPTHEAVDNQIITASTSQKLEPKNPNNDQLLHSYSTDTEVDTENENEHNISHTTHDQSEQSERSDCADDDHTVPVSEDSEQSAKLSYVNKTNTREPPRTESDPEQETDQINANKKQKHVKHKRGRIDSNDEDTDVEPPKKKVNQGICSTRSTASTSDDTEPDMTSDITKN